MTMFGELSSIDSLALVGNHARCQTLRGGLCQLGQRTRKRPHLAGVGV